MRAIVKLTFPIIFIAIICVLQPLSAAAKTINIGIIADGPWLRFYEAKETLVNEVIDITSSQYDVQFPEALFVKADRSVSGINSAIDMLLADPEVDLIITLGRVASHQICKRRNLPKPVIAPLIIDAVVQKLKLVGEAPGGLFMLDGEMGQRIFTLPATEGQA